MPIAMPNRVAQPIHNEAFEPPCILRQGGGLFVPFYNEGNTAYLAGEPFVFASRVVIAQKTILPLQTGIVLVDWQVDALLNPAHTGDILQGATIWWDTALVATQPLGGGTAVAGVGAAVAAAPVAGFVLGVAIVDQQQTDVLVDDDGDPIAASTGSQRVRVVSLPGAATVI